MKQAAGVSVSCCLDSRSFQYELDDTRPDASILLNEMNYYNNSKKKLTIMPTPVEEQSSSVPKSVPTKVDESESSKHDLRLKLEDLNQDRESDGDTQDSDSSDGENGEDLGEDPHFDLSSPTSKNKFCHQNFNNCTRR